MTYLQFLLIFIIPLIVVEIIFFKRSNHHLKPNFLRGLYVLASLAFIYTTPWDNYLVWSNVWSYSENRVLGVVGYVPYEEYAFFILQTFLTGFWCFFIQQRIPISQQKTNNFFAKKIISLLLIMVTAYGFYSLKSEPSRYLGLILAWATPVLLLQWLVGASYIHKNLKVFIWTFLPPTIYLWMADSIAIYLRVWNISTTQTLGINFGVLPIEEAVFFLVTNLMVSQGLILFIAMRSEIPQTLSFLKGKKIEEMKI